MACKIFFNLPGGLKMPVLGYGTWEVNDAEVRETLTAALEAGYRHIDTAHVYGNEKAIGDVIHRWISSGKLKREELFIVTKLPPGGTSPQSLPKYLKRSLDRLQIDYIDLYLIHFPFATKDVEGNLYPMTSEGLIDFDMTTDHVAVWKALEAQIDAGLVKSIGLSNFNERQIKRVLENARIPPAVLQVELHAYFQQKELLEFCKKNKITVTAYSPLGAPGFGKFLEQFGQKIEVPKIMNEPVVRAIAKKHGKSEAQVLLRHIIQKGVVTIPKSATPVRIRENIDIFDFLLDDNDVRKLDGLDKGSQGRAFDFLFLGGVEKHPEYPF